METGVEVQSEWTAQDRETRILGGPPRVVLKPGYRSKYGRETWGTRGSGPPDSGTITRMPLFKVVAWREYVPPGPPDPLMILTRDNWNDYGFETTFHARLALQSGSLDLGTIKILRSDQRGGPTPLDPDFDGLSNDYCSLGQTMAYYEQLKLQDENLYSRILSGLRDVVYEPQIRSRFEHLDGFQKSLIRSSSAERVLLDGPAFLRPSSISGSDVPATEVRALFFTTVGGNPFKFQLHFGTREPIPGRISSIIGYNGSGKTRLLANVAMLSATPSQDAATDEFKKKYGQVLSKFPFGSIFAVSFSAFDNFELPGRNSEERTKVEERKEEYIYCGLRRLATGEPSEDETKIEVTLKSPDEIASNFEESLDRIETRDRQQLLIDCLTQLSMEPSFARLGLVSAMTGDSSDARRFFQVLSSGQKVVLNVLVQMIARLQRKSLILFDEPESHLHPPLLATLLRVMRLILERTDSFCLTATHSPVVLQETPSKYVHIIRRNGPATEVTAPQIETFGENVGTLTHEVFNLDSSRTDFHDVLASLAQTNSLPAIESFFGKPLGFQASSYLLSLGVQRD
jgi:predicted ATPase